MRFVDNRSAGQRAGVHEGGQRVLGRVAKRRRAIAEDCASHIKFHWSVKGMEIVKRRESEEKGREKGGPKRRYR